MKPLSRRLGGWFKRTLQRSTATRERRRRALAVLIAALLYPLTSGESLPAHRNDLCALFAEKPSWYPAMRASAERWDVSIATQMAIVQRESAFYSKARPARRKIFGFLPGRRLSSAYGYAQVLDGTWQDFRQLEGRSAARRDRFADVASFMGWYLHRLHKTAGISKEDPYRLYLAYHEGASGYLAGRAQKKAWLLRTAQQVAAQSQRFADQLEGCDGQLQRRRYLRNFLTLAFFVGLALWFWRRWRVRR